MNAVAAVPAPASVRADYIACMRQVPGAVAIIATAHDGIRGGLAATAWCSLSADPPTVLACVNRNASAHDLIIAAGGFSVNLLTTAHREVVAIFSAQRGLNGDERFTAGGWTPGMSGHPVLDDALTTLECELADRHDSASHTILIGRVVAVACRGGREPLLYLNGMFSRPVAIPP